MYKIVKRWIDIIGAICGLIFLFPLFVILALVIKLDSEGPIFFRQRRLGRDKKEFYILKFRTMKQDTPANIPTHQLRDAKQYLTRSGKWLRKMSLDELPQLVNILKGDMSFIGPRPALWNQEDLIEKREQYGANHVPVGLSGWAQVNGRDKLSIEEKAKLDGEYARQFGFFMDVKCFLWTIRCVIKKEGIQEGE